MECELRLSVQEKATISENTNPDTGGDGESTSGDGLSNSMIVALDSKIRATLGGAVQVLSDPGNLYTRGETVNLGVYFCNFLKVWWLQASNPPERSRALAGRCGSSSTITAMLRIYKGNRKAEAWKNNGAGGYVSGGVFGTLTKQLDGSFTRTTKKSVYYDFDSTGRIKTIKDRSADGNVIYYNYNAGKPSSDDPDHRPWAGIPALFHL